MPARLRVLAKGEFHRFHGNYANNSGVEFQVTECEHDGRRFFVRENFRYDTFTSNSGVRWGLQQGHTVSGVNMTVMEYLAHGWDLASATGQGSSFAEAEAADALNLAKVMLLPEYQGEGMAFGAIVPVSGEAPPS